MSSSVILYRCCHLFLASAHVDLSTLETQKFENVQFLRPLVEKAVQKDPKRRPSAVDALQLLEYLVSSQTDHSLRWRLIVKDPGGFSRLVLNFGCTGREAAHAVRKTLTEHGRLSRVWKERRPGLSAFRRDGTHGKRVCW